MPEILGIIPARKGSKRLPGKNKMVFNGKPLIQNIIEIAIATKRLSQIVVTTDDEEILNLAPKYPNIRFIQRPAELAADESPAIDYLRHALNVLSDSGQSFDIIVILQPTSPLTIPEDIEGTVDLLLNSKADSAVSVVKLDHAIHPMKMKTMNGLILKPYLEEERGRMAEQDLPEIFVRNCSVYASRISVINSGKIIGDKCLGYLMPRERSIDINDGVDLAFAEFLVQRLKK